VGDLMLSREEFAPESESEYKAVAEVFVREGLLWELRIAGRTIRTTAEHPFFRDGDWTEANRLSEGDRLLLEDGSTAAVESIRDTGEWSRVHNVRIANHHTYFVGSADWGFSVWAHNANYDVGTANNLRKSAEKGTQVNHAPQSSPAESLIGGFNRRNKVGNEPAIRLSRSEHEAVTAAQAARGALPSARDLLASDIRILRNLTNAPYSALKKLLDMSRELHPSDYLPLHRSQ